MNDTLAMQYPQLAKKEAHLEEIRHIGEFLSWLASQGMFVARQHVHIDECWEGDELACDYNSGELEVVSNGENPDKLIAPYLGIDLVALERERQALLAGLRG